MTLETASGTDPVHGRCLLLLLALGCLCSPALGQPQGYLAIIIDDIGYNAPLGQAAAQLPGDFTLAVLPFTPHGVALAQLGHRQGKEIMLHIPMSNSRNIAEDPGTLDADMDRQTFLDTLIQGLEEIPHLAGANNHMGSLLTEQSQPMHWLMAELAQRHLYFVDSRTSADSVALDVARLYGLPSLKRDVFLDNQRQPEHILAQLDAAIELAQTQGYALAIGHPYPETLAVLQEAPEHLAAAGVELVFASALLEQFSPARAERETFYRRRAPTDQTHRKSVE